MSTPPHASRRRPGIVAGFAIAVAFLTRVPIGPPAEAGWRLADAAWAFPLVGAGIGVIAALCLPGRRNSGLGPGPAALLAVLAGLGVTGALHEDGLADTADGFFGGGDRERRLAIMRDSRHGTYGILALVLSVGLRAAALAQTGEAIYAGLALIAAHAASRALLPAAMRALPPARDDGLGADAGRPGARSILAAAAIGGGDRLGGARAIAAGRWRLPPPRRRCWPPPSLPSGGSAATPAMSSAPSSKSEKS